MQLRTNSGAPGDKRYQGLAAGVYACLAISTVYSLSLLTDHIKTAYNIGQQELATITTIGYAFGMFGLPAGFMYDRYGPQHCFVVGAALLVSGCCFLGRIFDGSVAGTVVTFSLCYVLVAWPSGWVDAPSLLTNMYCFPLNRGDVVALQKTFVGLGGTVFAIYYMAFFKDQYVNFCWFLSAVGLASIAFAMYTIRLPPFHPKSGAPSVSLPPTAVTPLCATTATTECMEWKTVPADSRRLRIGYAALGVMMLLAFGYSITSALFQLSQGWRVAIGIAVSITLASFLLMAIPMRAAATSSPVKSDSPDSACVSVATRVEAPQNTRTFMYNLQHSPDLWLLWWVCFCVFGSALTVIINSAQIYRAVNDNSYDSDRNTLFVATIGIASGLSRISVGQLDRVLERHGFCISILLPVTPSLCAAGLLLLTVLPADGLFLPFILVPASHGACLASMTLCSRMMFSPATVGKHYNFMFTGGMAGIILLNRLLFGKIYDHHSHAQNLYPHCAGHVCVSASVLTMAVANVTAAAAGFVVHRRWVRGASTAESHIQSGGVPCSS